MPLSKKRIVELADTTNTTTAVEEFKPFWTTTDGKTVKLYLGDVTDVLKQLPAKSVHCCVTSPPYWGLRDYKTGTWQGGNDHECNHVNPVKPSSTYKTKDELRDGNPVSQFGNQFKDTCSKCGAKRIDKQLGSEPLHDCGTDGQAQCGRCFVCSMVSVFREVRRVLRDDGTCWVNLGDSYGGSGGPPSDKSKLNGGKGVGSTEKLSQLIQLKTNSPLPSGNLVGIPWRVALAMQADGWILRQDIIWAKPSPMPESVQNRCTKSHEYIFLFSKKQGYFYDADAIKDKSIDKESLQGRNPRDDDKFVKEGIKAEYRGGFSAIPEGKTYETKNKRSVWSVSSQGYDGAHFATFPPKLITPCILAGTSEKGCCGKCGTPWVRIVDKSQVIRERPNEYVKRMGEEGTGNSCSNSVAGVDSKTIGWRPNCTCFGKLLKNRVVVEKSTARIPGGEYDPNGMGRNLRDVGDAQKTITVYESDLPLEEHPISPCVVLDPFIGSGTICCVSLQYGRDSIGIDLSEKYLKNNAVPRIEGALLAIPSKVYLVPRKSGKIDIGKVVSKKETKEQE